MHARSGQIANLILAVIISIVDQYPSAAQYVHNGLQRYARIGSIHADKRANLLLINLQGKSRPVAPQISYLPGADGRTIMVADFAGLIFSEGARVFKPENSEIDSVRIGQFQESPPVLRISISTSNPVILKKLDFRCQPKSLVVKFPDVNVQPSVAGGQQKPLLSDPEQLCRSKAENKSLLPSVAASAQIKSGSTNSLPFRAGGLYLPISADPPALLSGSKQKPEPPAVSSGVTRRAAVMPPEAPPVVASRIQTQGGAASAAELRAPSAQKALGAKERRRAAVCAEKEMPPLAPPLSPPASAPQKREAGMPGPAPPISAGSRALLSETNGPPSGLAGRLRRLFHRAKQEASLSNEQPSADALPLRPVQTPANSPSVSPAALPQTNISQTGISQSGSAKNPARAALEAAPACEAQDPRVEFAGDGPLRIKLSFDGKLKYKSFRLDNPPRYVIDLFDRRASSNPLPEPPAANQLLKAIRMGNPEDKHMRVVLDLARERVVVKEELDAAEQSLTLTLAEIPQPAAAARTGLVVLDAGHGGSDPGAQRGDVQEKDITLSITRKLKNYLEEKGIKVLMTRSEDSFVSLEERSRITNQARADAFVSVHINSLESDRDIQGIETYYQTEQSRELADKVHAQLVDGLKVPDRSIRKARFYVINHTDKPAILAEVGFISNRDERDKLISSDYQSKIAESLGQGVILYLGNSLEPQNTVVSAPQTGEAHRVPSGKKVKPALAISEQNAVKQ